MRNWMGGVRVRRGLQNGLLAWCLGFALYMVPSLVVAFRLWLELVRQGRDSAAISSQIGQRVSTMYAGSPLLTTSLIVMTALAVLWRARTLAGGVNTGATATGLIVGTVAAALTVAMFLAFGAFGWRSIVVMVVYVSAAALGSMSVRGGSVKTS